MGSTNLDQLRIQLEGLVGVGNGVTIGLGLDVCLIGCGTCRSVTRANKGGGHSATHLGSVREEGWLLVVQRNGLGIVCDGPRVVAGGELLVALVLEVDGFLRHGGGARSGGRLEGEARDGRGGEDAESQENRLGSRKEKGIQSPMRRRSGRRQRMGLRIEETNSRCARV